LKGLIKYLQEITGIHCHIRELKDYEKSNLPMYMQSMYLFYITELFNTEIIFLEPTDQLEIKIAQIETHLNTVRDTLKKEVVVVFYNLQAYQRSRLIERKIQFIVPGQNLFMPYLLVDLKPLYESKVEKSKKLSPAAQMILLWYLLDKEEKFDFRTSNFKDVAAFFDYSAMTISKVAKELFLHDICSFQEEGKDKFIQFKADKKSLWFEIEEKLSTPISKKLYFMKPPSQNIMVLSSWSALPEYTAMNPSRETYFAIYKEVYYKLREELNQIDTPDKQAPFVLEIWKYNPAKFSEINFTEDNVIDPLSLYLILKEGSDERTFYELEDLIDHIW
jgi:hypothetical protein